MQQIGGYSLRQNFSVLSSYRRLSVSRSMQPVTLRFEKVRRSVDLYLDINQLRKLPLGAKPDPVRRPCSENDKSTQFVPTAPDETAVRIKA